MPARIWVALLVALSAYPSLDVHGGVSLLPSVVVSSARAQRAAGGLSGTCGAGKIEGTVEGSYSAVSPGPLPDALAATYAGGRYEMIVLKEPLTLHRAWHDGGAREFGAFWSLEAPAGSMQARIDSALRPEWGNQATRYTTITVPAGTRVYAGQVGSQGGAWVGGGSQLLIEGGPQASWKIGEGTLE